MYVLVEGQVTGRPQFYEVNPTLNEKVALWRGDSKSLSYYFLSIFD